MPEPLLDLDAFNAEFNKQQTQAQERHDATGTGDRMGANLKEGLWNLQAAGAGLVGAKGARREALASEQLSQDQRGAMQDTGTEQAVGSAIQSSPMTLASFLPAGLLRIPAARIAAAKALQAATARGLAAEEAMMLSQMAATNAANQAARAGMAGSMGALSAPDAYDDAKHAGATDGTAMTNAIGSAFTEAGASYLAPGGVESAMLTRPALTGGLARTLLRVGKEAGHHAIGEATEEGLTEGTHILREQALGINQGTIFDPANLQRLGLSAAAGGLMGPSFNAPGMAMDLAHSVPQALAPAALAARLDTAQPQMGGMPAPTEARAEAPAGLPLEQQIARLVAGQQLQQGLPQDAPPLAPVPQGPQGQGFAGYAEQQPVDQTEALAQLWASLPPQAQQAVAQALSAPEAPNAQAAPPPAAPVAPGPVPGVASPAPGATAAPQAPVAPQPAAQAAPVAKPNPKAYAKLRGQILAMDPNADIPEQEGGHPLEWAKMPGGVERAGNYQIVPGDRAEDPAQLIYADGSHRYTIDETEGRPTFAAVEALRQEAAQHYRSEDHGVTTADLRKTLAGMRKALPDKSGNVVAGNFTPKTTEATSVQAPDAPAVAPGPAVPRPGPAAPPAPAVGTQQPGAPVDQPAASAAPPVAQQETAPEPWRQQRDAERATAIRIMGQERGERFLRSSDPDAVAAEAGINGPEDAGWKELFQGSDWKETRAVESAAGSIRSSANADDLAPFVIRWKRAAEVPDPVKDAIYDTMMRLRISPADMEKAMVRAHVEGGTDPSVAVQAVIGGERFAEWEKKNAQAQPSRLPASEAGNLVNPRPPQAIETAPPAAPTPEASKASAIAAARSGMKTKQAPAFNEAVHQAIGDVAAHINGGKSGSIELVRAALGWMRDVNFGHADGKPTTEGMAVAREIVKMAKAAQAKRVERRAQDATANTGEIAPTTGEIAPAQSPAQPTQSQAPPAFTTPEQAGAEARRRFLAKRKARQAAGPVAAGAPTTSPVVSGKAAPDAKQAALAEARAKLMQLGKQLGGAGVVGDLSMSDQQAGQTDDAAFGAIEALHRAGLTDFRAMLEQVQAFGLPFAGHPEFHSALEDAFDAFQEVTGLTARGELTAASVLGASPQTTPADTGDSHGTPPTADEQQPGRPAGPGVGGVDQPGGAGGGGQVGAGAGGKPGGRRGGPRVRVPAGRGSDSATAQPEPRPAAAPGAGEGAGPVLGVADESGPGPGAGAAPGERAGGAQPGGPGSVRPVPGSGPGTGADAAGGRRGAGDRAGADGVPGAAGQPEPGKPVASAPNAGRPDYHLADPEKLLGGSGPKTRFKRNRLSIETFEQVRAENRAPTSEQLDAIASYIGWGSFGQELFQGTWETPRPAEGWEAEDAWLREHMGQKDWESAQGSIINAHYTDPITVGAMWDALRHLGFTGGRVLEPSAGIGNFFALMPRDLHQASQLTGIELDSTTANMAKMLHPNANIREMGYEKSKTADNFYDLAIGNVPFGDFKLADSRYDRFAASIHNYFFLKAIDQVRPGGFVAFITSSYTMDGSKAERVREYLAAKGDLVAAIRLPTGAFKQYAGTSVVTDIIILQKRALGSATAGMPSWTGKPVEVKTAGGKVMVNPYFAENPKRILGTLNMGSGTTRGAPGMIVDRPKDLEQRLADLPASLPKGIMVPREQTGVAPDRYVANNTTARQGELVEQGGELFTVAGDHLKAWDKWKGTGKDAAKKNARVLDGIKGLFGIRAAYGAVLDVQRNGDEKATAKALAELNRVYDAFVGKHGPINTSEAIIKLEKAKDPSAERMRALEREEGGDYVKRPVFLEPQLRSRPQAKNLSVGDAYAVARNEGLTLDLARVAELSKRPVGDVERELVGGGQIYRTPTGAYEPSDVYLAGNVRVKLHEAEDAAAQGVAGLERSIDALRKVVPKDIPYPSIEVKLGATWVTSADYADFLARLMNEPAGYFTVSRLPDSWKVIFERDFINRKPEAEATWGHQRIPFSRLFQAAINNQSVTIKDHGRDEHGNPTEEVNPEATAEANAQVEKIREEFKDWLWSDPIRATRLERAYNDTFNAIAIPDYNGSHLAFEGLALMRGNDPFAFRQHQANAVWRGILTGRGIGAHEVGTGKTYTMAGLVHESRRLGLARKPLILAHNANASDVASDFQSAYPGARHLYVDNLSPKERDRTLQQIATDDWDAVVMPHSLLNRLCLKPETVKAMLREQIKALEDAAYEAVDEDGGDSSGLNHIFDQEEGDLDTTDKETRKKLAALKSPTAKELVKSRFRLTAQIERARQLAAEGAVSIEDMGIDMLVVDEAHVFKKLPIATKMKLKGLNVTASDQGAMLMMVADYIRQSNNGRGVHLFTGTPITNTVNEIYNMQRLVMAEDMRRDGVLSWDGWFNNFAQSVDEVELTSGGTWDTVTRLSAFVNVPELRRMVGQVMDTVFASDMPEFKPRPSKDGLSKDPQGRPHKEIKLETAPMTPEQAEQTALLKDRYGVWTRGSKKERKGWMQDGAEFVPVIIETEGVKSAMDPRLVDMSAPGEDPNLKVNRCTANILQHYRGEPQSVQMVFMQTGYSDSATRVIKGSLRNPVTGERPTHEVTTFNVAKALVDKLVAEGVPRDQIVIFKGGVSAEKKAEYAAAMRAGEIRVAIGSSETMGTGVNAQTYLRVMHHLDAPWMPGHMEQRNGRGHRQGNKFNTVLEYRYLTEGSHDGRRWQVLLTKSRFITKFMKDDLGDARVIEGDATNMDEEGGDTEGFAATFGTAVGDPRIQIKTKLEKDVKKLEGNERRHAQAVSKADDDLKKMAGDRSMLVQQVEKQRTDAETYARFAADPFSIEIEGKEYTDRAEADLALQALGKAPSAAKKGRIGRYRGFRLMFQDNGPHLLPDLRLAGATEYPAVWGTQSLDAKLRGIVGQADKGQERIAKLDESRASMEDMRGRPFARKAELEAKRKRLGDVMGDLQANPEPAPAWLRDGAPVGSTVLVDGKDYAVAGHQVRSDGYAVLIEDGNDVRPVPIHQIRDDQGGEIFADKPAAPPAKPTAQPVTPAAPSSPTRTPNGFEVGQGVTWPGGTGTVARIERGTLDDERTWQVEVRRADGTADMVSADQLTAADAPADLGAPARPAAEDSPERDAAFFIGADEKMDATDAPGDLSAPGGPLAKGNIPIRTAVAPLPPTGGPGKLGDIILQFGNALTGSGLGKTEFSTAGMRSTQKGVYKPTSGQTAIRHNNLDAAAHEIAHRVDDFFPMTNPATTDPKAVRSWKRAMKELHWFSYFGSTPGPGLSRPAKMAYHRAEGWAEWLRAYIVNPAEAKRLSPSMEALYQARVPEAVRQSIEDYSQKVRQFAGQRPSAKTAANIRGIEESAGAAARATVGSKMRAAVDELGQIIGRFLGDVGEKGSKARKAAIPSLGDSKLGITSGDKTTFGWYDSWWPAIKGYRTALAMRGGAAPMIDNDFETLVRLNAGFADRMDSMFVDGLVDQQNKPIMDGGKRINLEWLLEPATKDGLTKAEIAAELDAAMAQGVEERTVEEGKRNLEKARQAAKRFRLQMFIANPADPDIDMKARGELRRLVGEAREQNSRMTGIAGGLDSDYEQARRAMMDRYKDDPKAQARRKEILRRYRAWANAVLDYTVAAGVMGKDQAAGLKQSHQAYIDLHRVIETESTSLPTKAFHGSSRTIDNPLVNLMHATWSAMQWADGNRVRRSFVDALELPRGLHQGTPVDLNIIGRQVTEDEMKPAKDGGKRDDAGKIDGRKPYPVRQLEMKQNPVTGLDQEVAVTEWWTFDPAVEAGFEAANAFDNPGALDDLMHGLKRLTQKTITAAPPFLIRQVQRDTVSRLITSEVGSSMLDLLDGYGADLAGKGVMERYQTSGAGQAGWDEKGKEAYQRRMMGVIYEAVHDENRIVSTARGLGRGYMNMAAESDLANRRAEFVRAWRQRYAQEKKDGVSEDDAQFRADLHAATHSRGLMDFAVAGHHARKINRYIVFFNAAMQAQRRMARALGPEHRATTITRTVLLGAASAMLWAIVRASLDDKEKEEQRQRPAFKRDFAWSFKIAPNLWIDVPKPYEWGVMASAFERALDQATGNKNAWEGYPTSVKTAVLPFKEEYLAGSFRPFIEASTNYSWFQDRQIVPQYEVGKDLDLRKGNKNASELGQAVQKAIGVDARKVDHVVSSLFGGFGRIATARSSDPGWWLGASAGMSSRSPAWEAEDVKWAMDYGERRGIGGRKEFDILRDRLKASSTATNAAERDKKAAEARAYATILRKRYDQPGNGKP